MNFDQSGLPPIQLVQDAFTHSLTHVKAGMNEALRNFERQIARAHRENVQMLDVERRQTKMSDEDYQKELAELEQMRDEQLKVGPRLIAQELDRNFVKSHVAPARELFKHAEKAAPEAIAAIMLVECVRSPKDFKAIEAAFGPVVSGMVAELIHIEAYTEDRKANLGGAPDDVKRAYTALTIASLENIGQQAEAFAKRNPGRRIVFPDGQEQQLFENSKVIWGVDKKLEERLISVFNKTAGHVMSKLRFNRDQDGDLALVPYVPPKPPAPPTPPKDGGKNLPVVRKPPNNNGSIGGKDVF